MNYNKHFNIWTEKEKNAIDGIILFIRDSKNQKPIIYINRKINTTKKTQYIKSNLKINEKICKSCFYNMLHCRCTHLVRSSYHVDTNKKLITKNDQNINDKFQSCDKNKQTKEISSNQFKIQHELQREYLVSKNIKSDKNEDLHNNAKGSELLIFSRKLKSMISKLLGTIPTSLNSIEISILNDFQDFIKKIIEENKTKLKNSMNSDAKRKHSNMLKEHVRRESISNGIKVLANLLPEGENLSRTMVIYYAVYNILRMRYEIMHQNKK